jgi:hypothetical protein
VDSRQICAFFLGWVFFCSLQCIARSPFSRSLVDLFARRVFIKKGKDDPEARYAAPQEKEIGVWQSDSYSQESLTLLRKDNHVLLFTLSLCFLFASMAQFASLLTFSHKGGAACGMFSPLPPHPVHLSDIFSAFVVAWGGLASQLARLVGLLMLLLELRRLGISTLEWILCWVTLAVGLGRCLCASPWINLT